MSRQRGATALIRTAKQLACVLALLVALPGRAIDSTPVRVTNPASAPVPVTGAVGVTGPVSVTRAVGVTGPVSVSRTVGISGTPAVNTLRLPCWNPSTPTVSVLCRSSGCASMPDRSESILPVSPIGAPLRSGVQLYIYPDTTANLPQCNFNLVFRSIN